MSDDVQQEAPGAGLAEEIADTERWIELHKGNRYQREAARRMRRLLDRLAAERARVVKVEREVEAVRYELGDALTQLATVERGRLCSQCGEQMACMVKIGTSDGWCSTCLDEAADSDLADLRAAVAAFAETLSQAPITDPASVSRLAVVASLISDPAAVLAEVRADERRRCVEAIRALRPDAAMPSPLSYREALKDVRRILTDLGEDADCGHPNHAADDHACRPFLGGEEVRDG